MRRGRPASTIFSGGIPKAGGASAGADLSWGGDGFGFDDFLDIINPLQHLPVVASIYRWLTNDEIAPAARVAGGTLFGGPVGLMVALINNSIESDTGKDMGAHVIAALGGGDGGASAAKDRPVQVAAATPQTRAAVPLEPASPQPSTTGPAGPAATTTPQLQAAMKASQQMPTRLSPQAFDALMRSIGAKPMAQIPSATPAAAPSGGIGAEALRASAADVLPTLKRRGAAMDLYRLLSGHVASRAARSSR